MDDNQCFSFQTNPQLLDETAAVVASDGLSVADVLNALLRKIVKAIRYSLT
ncbi:hypothetical protein LQZ24_02840 [Fructobacillus sp. M1-13]|uniref:Uncharacterized protein n=1 Tax=Fructobacillus papyriferae TaxID=2713171 RepID=A0ABS5QQB8_9LACO|nr:hypothetical protein [Fructobacillus papyriferae]MBS9335364.1 hypothetical protein [Fructobacillus papyriferae]MCD2158968.1 hypothetical protein [Fructobacillus papyriferae]